MNGANFENPWAQVIGPVCTLTGEAQVNGAILSVGRPYGPSIADLEQFQNYIDFWIKLRRFPKTKLRDFSNIR